VDLFKETYLPAIKQGGLERFALFTLTDAVERNDSCANIYNKSLLYLVSHAFEEQPRIPFSFNAERRNGVPILGMEKFARHDDDLKKLFRTKAADYVLSPNAADEGSADHATSMTHGGFDDDDATLRATLVRIMGGDKVQAAGATTMSPLTKTIADRRSALPDVRD
jgi:hypothetical protein